VVEKVIELAAGTKGAEALNIIDMCTGTGAIAVSLAMNLKDSKVYAVDISETALECCGVNVERLGLNDRVEIIRSDLFTSVHEELLGQIDIIVSNPPYIPRDEIKQLKINVKGYEPLSALDGGEDGLEFYRRISRDGQEYLKKGGILAFEIGYEQGVYVKDIMEESGYYTGFGIEKDLAGFDRCVWGSRK
jgi:release factor glutamine methyltransferase